jgi:hypothetical protein
MDDAPVIFKKKGKSATRPRVSSPLINDATPNEIPKDTPMDEDEPSASALAAKLKKQRRDKTGSSKSKARVSFGGDDEVSPRTGKEGHVLMGLSG